MNHLSTSMHHYFWNVWVFIKKDDPDINVILHGIIPLYFEQSGNVTIDKIKNILAAFKVSKGQMDALGGAKPGMHTNYLNLLKGLNKVKFYNKIYHF